MHNSTKLECNHMGGDGFVGYLHTNPSQLIVFYFNHLLLGGFFLANNKAMRSLGKLRDIKIPGSDFFLAKTNYTRR